MLDAASRKERGFKVDPSTALRAGSSELREQRKSSGKDKAEMGRAQRWR